MLERQLYLARKTVIEMLKDRGLKTNNLIKGFIPSDFETIFKSFDNYSGVFDIETSDDFGNRTYVKFIRYINEKNNSIKNLSGAKDVKSAKVELKNIYNFIVSTKNLLVQDTLIFIVCYGDQIEESHIRFEEEHEILQIFHISQLQFNITHHRLVPKHILIDEREKAILKKKLYLNSFNKLPTILGSDPIAKYYNMKNNDICKVLRPSKTTGLHPFYRICKSNKDRFIKIQKVTIIENPKRKRARNPKKKSKTSKSKTPTESSKPKSPPKLLITKSISSKKSTKSPEMTQAEIDELFSSDSDSSPIKQSKSPKIAKSTLDKKTDSSDSKLGGSIDKIKLIQSLKLDKTPSSQEGGSIDKIKLIQSLKLGKPQKGGDINLIPEKTMLNADNSESILSQPKIDQLNIKVAPKIETNIVNKTILNANKNTTNVKTNISNIDKTNIIGTTIENGSDQLVLNDSALNEAISLGNFDMNLLND